MTVNRTYSLPAVLLSCVLAAGFVWAGASATTQTVPVREEALGRFYLVQTTHQFAGSAQADILLRVDTVSGQTWRYVPPMEGHRVNEGWLPIPEITDQRQLQDRHRFLP